MIVFKYPCQLGTPFELELPVGAEVVEFSAQHGENLFLWAIVDLSHDVERRTFLVVGTGWAFPDGGRYVDSWVSDDFVWHLFEYPR